jgi:hypothetical protein
MASNKTPTGWKKIDTYTCRGKIQSDTAGAPFAPAYHIRLWDGRFDTAWRIDKFEIWPGNVSDDASTHHTVVAKLQTTNWGGNPTRYDNWHFGDQRELGWAMCAFDSNYPILSAPVSIVDKENLVVEDMWVCMNSYDDTADGNFYIEMTKYKVPRKVAILAMIKNLSMAERLTA